MVYYSENQGEKYATKAIMPKPASLTQNMNILRLKIQVSDSTHSTQQDQLKNAPPKSTVQKLTEPTPSVAWTRGRGGTRLPHTEGAYNYGVIRGFLYNNNQKTRKKCANATSEWVPRPALPRL